MTTELLDRAFSLIDGMPSESKLLGFGVSAEEISAAEAVLDIKFPKEYASFLTRYGYGGVGGFEIFGLPTTEHAEEFAYPHVIELNREMRDAGMSKDILAFKVAGNGEAYGLDLSNSVSPKVVAFWPGDVNDTNDLEVISQSFGEHLLSEIGRVRRRMGSA